MATATAVIEKRSATVNFIACLDIDIGFMVSLIYSIARGHICMEKICLSAKQWTLAIDIYLLYIIPRWRQWCIDSPKAAR